MRPNVSAARPSRLRRRSAAAAVLLLTALMLLASPVQGQSSPGERSQRWAFTAAAGRALSGPERGLESWVMAGGYGGIKPDTWCFKSPCTGVTQYPLSHANHGAVQAGLRRQVTGWGHATAVLSATSLGTTLGYRHSDVASEASHIQLDQSAVTIALLGGVGGARTPWVAAGPALYRVAISRGTPDLPRERNDAPGPRRAATWTAGTAVAAGLPVPLPGSFFVELQTQHRRVGETELGPVGAGTADAPREMPRGRIRSDHTVLLLALGRRF